MQVSIASATENVTFDGVSVGVNAPRNLLQDLLLRHRWLAKVEFFFTNDADYLRITCGRSDHSAVSSFAVPVNRLVFHDARATFWSDGFTALPPAALAQVEGALTEITRSLANLHCCFACCERQLRHALQADERTTAAFDRSSITDEDAQILDLLCQGRTNKEISDILGMTSSRVRHSTSRIFDRLGVKNRYEATAVWSTKSANN